MSQEAVNLDDPYLYNKLKEQRAINADLHRRIEVLTNEADRLASELEHTKGLLLEKSHALDDETGKFELLRHEVLTLQALISQHDTEAKSKTLEVDFWKSRVMQERETFSSSLEKIETAAFEKISSMKDAHRAHIEQLLSAFDVKLQKDLESETSKLISNYDGVVMKLKRQYETLVMSREEETSRLRSQLQRLKADFDSMFMANQEQNTQLCSARAQMEAMELKHSARIAEMEALHNEKLSELQKSNEILQMSLETTRGAQKILEKERENWLESQIALEKRILLEMERSKNALLTQKGEFEMERVQLVDTVQRLNSQLESSDARYNALLKTFHSNSIVSMNSSNSTVESDEASTASIVTTTETNNLPCPDQGFLKTLSFLQKEIKKRDSVILAMQSEASEARLMNSKMADERARYEQQLQDLEREKQFLEEEISSMRASYDATSEFLRSEVAAKNREIDELQLRLKALEMAHEKSLEALMKSGGMSQKKASTSAAVPKVPGKRGRKSKQQLALEAAEAEARAQADAENALRLEVEHEEPVELLPQHQVSAPHNENDNHLTSDFGVTYENLATTAFTNAPAVASMPASTSDVISTVKRAASEMFPFEAKGASLRPTAAKKRKTTTAATTSITSFDSATESDANPPETTNREANDVEVAITQAKIQKRKYTRRKTLVISTKEPSSDVTVREVEVPTVDDTEFASTEPDGSNIVPSSYGYDHAGSSQSNLHNDSEASPEEHQEPESPVLHSRRSYERSGALATSPKPSEFRVTVHSDANKENIPSAVTPSSRPVGASQTTSAKVSEARSSPSQNSHGSQAKKGAVPTINVQLQPVAGPVLQQSARGNLAHGISGLGPMGGGKTAELTGSSSGFGASAVFRGSMASRGLKIPVLR